jgi:methyl coenzyme M reductase beta subunit
MPKIILYLNPRQERHISKYDKWDQVKEDDVDVADNANGRDESTLRILDVSIDRSVILKLISRKQSVRIRKIKGKAIPVTGRGGP